MGFHGAAEPLLTRPVQGLRLQQIGGGARGQGRLDGGAVDANVADWHSEAALATSPGAAETMA